MSATSVTASPSDELHFEYLRCAFAQWRKFLYEVKNPCNWQVFEHLYKNIFGEKEFSNLKGKQRPHFNDKSYPSLFDGLNILGEDGTPNWEGLPNEWSLEDINENIKDNPLAKLLLAYIWKQGEYPRVALVLNAINGREPPENPAVMPQFGMHLKAPLSNPIFDQHTSRQMLLLDKIEVCENVEKFKELFGRSNGIPIEDSALNDNFHRDKYLDWWGSYIEKRLPTRDFPRERGKAILWSDRLMFSLGKAAKGVFALAIKKSDEKKKDQDVKNDR